jgi:membrane fusion protein (multidrug efflux system)
VTVRAVFPNQEHTLLPGMFVRAVIDRGMNDRAMLVPQEGITHDRTGKATVLLVGADGMVSQQVVDATRTLGNSWVVEGGLRDGDRVIVSGLQRIQPGMRVSAIVAKTQTPARVSRNAPVRF